MAEATVAKLTKGERDSLHAYGKSYGMGALARDFGVSPKQLNFWIAGFAVPSAENIRKVRRRLSKSGAPRR